MSTFDHEYSVILESERENVSVVCRMQLLVAHYPPRVPLPTLLLHL
jgi:hypothetical protein